MNEKRGNPMQGWQVLLNGKEIDIVWCSPLDDANDVKRSLVNHDGYHPDIIVRKWK